MSSRFRRVWVWWWGLPISTRFAIGIWLTVLGGVFGRVLFSPVHAQSVVPIYLAAGERWRASEPLYPPLSGLDLFRNPPFVAALFVPFSLLPAKLAAILWRLVCVTLYLLGLRQLLRDVLLPLSTSKRNIYWILSALLVIPSFNNGQLNLLIVAALLLGACAVSRQCWWQASAWFVLGGLLKIYPLSVGLLTVAMFHRQLGWRFALTILGFLQLPFLFQDPRFVWQAHFDYVNELRYDDRTVPEVLLTRAPRDWTIMPRLWFNVAVPRHVSQTVALSVAMLLAGRMALIGQRMGGQVFRPLILGLIWLLLFGPATENNTYSMLAPVAAVLACGAWPMRTWAKVCAWFATALLVLVIVRASFATAAFWGFNEVPPIASLFLFASYCGLRKDEVMETSALVV